MPWIKVIPEHAATGRLKRLYDKLIEPWGGVDHIMTIHSLDPRSLLGHLALYRAVMRGSADLSKIQREMIAVTVSAANRCHY